MSTSVARIGESPGTAVAWSQELEGAKMLLRSGLLPKAIGSAEAALFIILTGRDLGLSPVQSLRSINVIQGKIEVAADMQLGLFHRAGGKSHWAKLTPTEAVLRLSAPWLLEPHEESFTMEDAKQAGLTNQARSGEPSMFVKYPKPMLRSRAITAGLKSIGFDPTAGMYAEGELGGPEPVMPVEDVEDVRAAGGEVPAAEVRQATPADEVIADAKERQAMAELDAVLPTLAANQQEYVRTKLGEGADPTRLLEWIKERALAAPAVQPVSA